MDQPLKLGIAGLGTVGCGVVRILAGREKRLTDALGRNLTITGVSARDRTRDRGIDISRAAWFDDPVELARSNDIDVFVELIGGEDGPARASVEAALDAGKHVVTANKALLAHQGDVLAGKAEAAGLSLKFEAAVAGGIPIIKAMRESLVGNDVTRVYGILNGTCNYILTKMTLEGRDFDEILREAQAAGYAEADPAFDIGGFDTAHKLCLLTSLAFRTKVAFGDVYVEGIQGITPADVEAADDLGYRIKLIGAAVRTEAGIEQRVHPAMLPKNSAVAEVNGVTNCVAIEADSVGTILLVGPGAGAGPTASSVVSDIADVARGDRTPAFVTAAADLEPYRRGPMRAHEGGYYIRLSVIDRPGAFAAIATRMATENVSLESIVQRRPGSLSDRSGKEASGNKPTRVILTTHETTEASIRKALEGISADGHIEGSPQMIRIERL